MLLERGITVAQGRRRLARYLAQALDVDDAEALSLSSRMRLLIDDMRAQWRELDRQIAAFDAEFAAAARSEEPARRLSTIPGIGVINATALVAAVGDARSFGRGRDLAAGSVSSRDRRPPEAGHGSSASPNAATDICAPC